MPKIAGWEKQKDDPKMQVWTSRKSRVETDNQNYKQPTRVAVQGGRRRDGWVAQINRPNRNPKSPGFQEPIKKKFNKKSKAEDWAIDWMKKNEY